MNVTKKPIITIALWDQGKNLDQNHIEQIVNEMISEEEFQHQLTGMIWIETVTNGFEIVLRRSKNKSDDFPVIGFVDARFPQ